MDLIQRQLLVDVPGIVHNHPLCCLAALAAALLAGRRVFKHLINPSTYPNVLGPPRKSVVFGHFPEIFSPTNIEFHDALEETYGSVCKVYGLLGRQFGELRTWAAFVLASVLAPRANLNSAANWLYVCTASMHKAQRKVPIFDVVAKNVGIIYDTGTGRLVHSSRLQMKLAITKEIGGAQSKELDMLRPKWLRRKLAEWLPSADAQKLREIIDLQEQQAQRILAQKKAALEDQNNSEELHDVMSNKYSPTSFDAVKANMEAKEEDRLPEDQILGQMNGALARVLQILSQNQPTQDRLRAELLEAPDNMTYDELHSLEYLDAICRETLRLFPPVSFMGREAMEDRVVPLRYPVKGKDGKEIREIQVRKGTGIHVGIRLANRSKKTWGEDANEFKPDRWLERLPNSVSDARTPGVYSSIGFKLSILELKIVLSTLIKSFKFAPGTAQVEWLNYVIMAPYPLGTKNSIREGKEPYMPLNVSVL
ncbi:Cytokinin hydroxylase [Ceratobasidium theobromae]|uniref:Cytokinin hydroxylase n=1 Tax=Ceratobasidium theobromae TaxID=1582974 RepID=A0A5N5QI63_9AGAM|nr:Cytokinin hydroxylase [Ceratobasidium theobromae]